MQKKMKKENVQYTYNWKKIKDYTIEYIFNLILTDKKSTWYFDEENTKLKLRRVKLFLVKGCECVKCGVKGTYFSLREDGGGSKHVDLYGTTDDGREILINRDHIVPRSRGGSDHFSNLQPTCIVCNSLKGNYTEEELNGI